MSRTSSENVQLVLAENYKAGASLTAFIDTAYALTNKVHNADTLSQLDDTDLELIERWLAAYFYTVADPIYTSKSTGGASGSFEARSYWDQAKRLDVTGCLAKLDVPTRPKAGSMWLGKAPSEQTAYEDRN